jgi:hypothetical protein
MNFNRGVIMVSTTNPELKLENQNNKLMDIQFTRFSIEITDPSSAKLNEISFHVNKINKIKKNLLIFQDSELNTIERPYPIIKWPNRDPVEIYWGNHINDDPGGFTNFGFNNFAEFYSIPKKKLTRFLREGLFLLQNLFPLTEIPYTDKNFLKKCSEFYDELKKLANRYQNK